MVDVRSLELFESQLRPYDSYVNVLSLKGNI